MSTANQLSTVVRDWAKVFMNRSMSDFKRFMEDNGLSFTHVNILMGLFHGGISGVSEIGERMSITNAAASQTVDRLVQMGLIIRTENPHDRRAKQLELSRKGRDMIEKGVYSRSNWIEQLTDTLSVEELEMITSALIILTEAAKITRD
ncbi:MarR family winged helix-turn-helix transcriptional regulator [Chloroflexota bacterium]